MRPDKMQMPAGLPGGVEDLNQHVDRGRVEKGDLVQINPQVSDAGPAKLSQQNLGQLLLGTHVDFPGEGDKGRVALPADPVSPDVSHRPFLNRQSNHRPKSADEAVSVTPGWFGGYG